jgi:DamX protein
LLSWGAGDKASDAGVVPTPFPEDNGEHYFAGNAGRVQRLNLLTHLVPYGGVLLILGESGVGKSALLRQLLMKASDTCRICQLSASACIDPRQAVREMLDCFAWQVDADRSLGGAQLRILREHLGILRRNGYAPVLAIDDAESLPDTVFGMLEQLYDGDSADLLTLVLAGEPGLKQRLSTPLLQPLNAHVTHVLELQPFSAEEQTEYIRHHLQHVGIEGMGPFQSSALKFIYVASRGVPRRINELARVFWANKKTGAVAGGKGLSWLQHSGLRQLRYILPLVLISVGVAIFHEEIGTALFTAPVSTVAEKEGKTSALIAAKDQPSPDSVADSLRDPLPRATTQPAAIATESVTVPEEKPSFAVGTSAVPVAEVSPILSPAPDALVKQPAVAALPVPGPIPQQAGSDNSTVVAGAPAVTSIDLPQKPVVNSKTLPSTASDPVLAAADNSPHGRQKIQKQPLAKVQPPSGVGEAARNAVTGAATGLGASVSAGGVRSRGNPNVSTTAVVRDDDWWLTQPAEQYAVQLLAMEATVVRDYIARHQLTAANVATFQVSVGGEGLLAAALGPFATEAEAGKAAREWRQRLPGVKPWVRSIASIQQVVSDARPLQPWSVLIARHEQQLLHQQPQHYAVQLLAMDQGAVTRFVAKYRLTDRVVYFRTHSGGQELYAALLSSFPSREQAVAASNEIARQAVGVRPWVRTVDSVQQAIRSNHDRPR